MSSLYGVFQAQNYAYNYTQYDIEQGLPSSETYFAYQDEEGYMWFTTDRGIVRYDGYEFKTYTESDGLAELVNFKIHKDPRGGFMTMGKDGNITMYKNGNFKSFEYNDSITNISFDSITITFHLEIANINKEYILLKPIFMGQSRPIKYYYLIDRRTGGIRVIHIKNLNSIDLDPAYYQISKVHFAHSNITKISELSFNNLNYYYAKEYKSQNYIYVFHYDSLIYKRYFYEPFEYVYIDNDSSLWITNSNGLLYADHYSSSSLMKIELPQNIEISSLLKDNCNNLWIMTINNGIYKLNKSDFIKQFPLKKINNRIVKLFKNDSCIKLYVQSNLRNYFAILKDSIFHLVKNDSSFVFKDDSITFTKELNIDLYFKDLSDKYEGFKYSFKSNPIVNIQTYKNFTAIEIFNHLYISTSIKDSFKVIRSPYVNDFEFYKSGLLIGTMDGLYNYNISHNTLKVDTNNKIINDRVNDIQSFKHNCWIATLKNGVYFYSGGQLNGISNPYHSIKSINAIEIVNDTIALIGTARGLYSLNYQLIGDSIKINKSYWFGKSEGLKSSYITGIKQYNGQIYIGTLDGLYYFNWNNFKENTIVPKVHIDNVFLIDENDSLNKNTQIELKSYENNIQLNYTGLYFIKDQQLKYYRHKIHKNGQNLTNWIYTQNRSVLLNDLSPGDYTFTVQCRNNSSIWSEPATVSFSIAPHFTQTWAFRTGVITVIGALIWLYFYYRNKRLEKEQQMKNEMLSVEMQSTRSQMNPHFVFNGINAIQNFIFNEEKKNVNLYISKFSELIRDSLKMSKMDYISLEQEVEFLEKYLKLEKNRFPHKFNYSININSDKPAKEVLIPPLFVQTLAENAVKHAFKKLEYKGMLKITYTYNSNERVLFIKVADNGVGLLNISPENTEEEDNKGNSKSNTHLGLSLLKRRINIINKKNTRGVRAKFLVNYLEKSNRSGTIISIIIPLDYE